MLSTAACKPDSAHVLYEVPGCLDLHGDTGVVGRMCMHNAFNKHASDGRAPSREGREQLHMDIKGDLLARTVWLRKALTTCDPVHSWYFPEALLASSACDANMPSAVCPGIDFTMEEIPVAGTLMLVHISCSGR